MLKPGGPLDRNSPRGFPRAIIRLGNHNMAVNPGSRLGRYEVRSLLGAGGMGEVYLAYDHDLEREVAIKVLTADPNESSERTRRFLQEARASSALSHPNVATVFEIGSQDEWRFIAMELVPGAPLRARLREGAMAVDETLALATQIAAGLAAAHAAGIVHRDIKPENIMIRPDGYAKILDFGLAKLREAHDDGATILKTGTGVTMGTLSYMSPEQLSGGSVTAASDVFSFGVVLYEMICGRRPFEGELATEVAAAILTKDPAPIDAPPKLAAIVKKALARNPAERYASAGEMLEELRHITGAPSAAAAPTRERSRKPLIAVAAVLILAVAALAIWMTARAQARQRAQESIATAERLLEEGNFAEAFETASATLAILPAEQRLRDVIAKSSEHASFESDPPGATVFLERFKPPAERFRAGITPLKIANLPHADYRVTFELDGYAESVVPLPQYPIALRGGRAPVRPVSVSVKLIEAARVPAEMVVVPGGEYSLAGWQRMSNEAVQLQDYLIDRFEVSNSDFYAFVRDGGYRRRELWTTLPFEEVASFRDTTSLPGPRNWAEGAPPAGRETHPVTGVSWHEASAYAAWKGKQLPTIYQWEKAARYPLTLGPTSTFPWGVMAEGIDSSERMNFNDKDTVPVDSMPFGISPVGAYHMAGNVAEWTRNPLAPGYAVRGGSWNDALYSFGRTGAFPAMYASSEIGFRCVKPLEGDGSRQGEFALVSSGFVPEYQPVHDEAWEEIRARYAYDPVPLRSRVVERVDGGDWIREKIEYEVDGRTVPAFLYLPKHFSPPFQVVHFSPAGDVYNGWRELSESIDLRLAPLVRGGRAVFSVVMPGFVGRPREPGFVEPDSRSVEFVDFTVRQVKELRRGIDYLESRPEIDRSRIAFYAMSAGSWEGIILAAVESRYRSILLIGSGIHSREITDTPAANRINFAPRIRQPKMMLQGRYDESAPLESAARPLFKLMSEPKRLEVFEGGHVPAPQVMVPVMTKWFDETMGKVE